MNKLAEYLRDTKAELKHVSWPTQKQAMVFTALVIAISIIVSIYLGVFDFIFTGFIDFLVI